MERLGGLFFDGRRSCAEDSFVGRSGLYRGESFVVSVLVCVRGSVSGLEQASLSNGVPILVTAFVRYSYGLCFVLATARPGAQPAPQGRARARSGPGLLCVAEALCYKVAIYLAKCNKARSAC